MLKIDRGINTLFLRQGAIVEQLDMSNHLRTDMELPVRGFHTLYETQLTTRDGYAVTWAWVTAGLGDGIKYTVAVAVNNNDGRDIKAGWTRGHKDYVFVRPVPAKFVNAIRRLTPGQLYLIGQISGFDYAGYHKDGWYSRGLFATRLDLPNCLRICVDCADDELVIQPEVWRIKEGVLILFPDDSCRLMTFEEYLAMSFWDHPDYRQGDLMFFFVATKHDDPNIDYFIDMPNPYRIDRHEIFAPLIPHAIQQHPNTRQIYIAGPAKVQHPEHGLMELPEGLHEIKMLPGTSRPFQGGID